MENKKFNTIKLLLIISGILNVCLIVLVIFFSLVKYEKEYELQKLPNDFNLMSEAWEILKNDYIEKDRVDPKKLSQGAVKGMVQALDDKYSAYIDPDTYKLETSSFKGRFQGIGAYVGVRDNQLVIISPIDNSPAKEAGLKAGDKIIKINGEDTFGMSVTEAALKIQGPAGTSVTLTILREGQAEPFDLSIIRREVIIKSVYSEIKDEVLYVKLTGFTENTTPELQTELKNNSSKIKGIVLDLRNNPGGLLNVAVDVASQFLDKGVVVKAVDNQGRSTAIPVKFGGLATKLPLVVLINKGSASASEVVAGAIQDYDRAKLLGEPTFGKGSVQTIRNLSDGSAIHVTVARWMTPNGRPIEGVGLQPNLFSQLEDEELVKFAIEYLKSNIKINPSYK